MDDGRDAGVDVASTPESPEAPSLEAPRPTDQDGTLEEILARSSRDLVHTFAVSVSHSAAKEAGKTEEFRQDDQNYIAEFKRRLFRAIIDTYVWSTARLAHETETAEGQLAKGVQDLLSAERDQGRSSHSTPAIMDRLRARLADLMAAVSRALEMFG